MGKATGPKVLAVSMMVMAWAGVVPAAEAGASQTPAPPKTEGLDPWVGKYPMSFFTRTRSAATVGKGRFSASLNLQYFDWDEVLGADGVYRDRPAGQEKERLATTLCLKYGWAGNHHLALGIPYWFNDFDIPGKENDSHGFANMYVFEKWRAIQETNTMPAVAFDIWCYFPTGDSDRKLGIDDSSIKLTTEISKAWKDFSLHLNPGYTWGFDEAPDIGEFNTAVLIKPHKTFWPALEYNYFDKKNLKDKKQEGHSHDLVPGFIWKVGKESSFKLGVPISLDSTFTDRDRVGIMIKLFHRS
jgi:hypothetical protein